MAQAKQNKTKQTICLSKTGCDVPEMEKRGREKKRGARGRQGSRAMGRQGGARVKPPHLPSAVSRQAGITSQLHSADAPVQSQEAASPEVASHVGCHPAPCRATPEPLGSQGSLSPSCNPSGDSAPQDARTHFTDENPEALCPGPSDAPA